MTISEGVMLRKNMKIRLPLVRSTCNLTELESKRRSGQELHSAVEGRSQITLENSCSEVEAVLWSARKHECSMRLESLDDQKVKKLSSKSTMIDPLDHAMLPFCKNNQENDSEVNEREKYEHVSNMSNIDKCGPPGAFGGQKRKKQDTNSSVILDFEDCPATTSRRGKRISVVDVNKVGPVKRFDGRKVKRQILDNGLPQDCMLILKKLMTHPFGWVFNEPVDPVKLKIPDYFSIISEPMDLGTIKHRLEKKLYKDAKEFASDVRLTFSNAMRYNPPANEIHIIASKLNKLFESQWKSVQEKGDLQSSRVIQEPNLKVKFKETQTTTRGEWKGEADSCLKLKPIISSTVKNTVKKDLKEISKEKISPDLLDCLKNSGLIGQHEEKIEVDIDAFDNKKLLQWHTVLRRYLDSKSAESTSVKSQSGSGTIQEDPNHGIKTGNRNVHGNLATRTSQCSSKNNHIQVKSDSDRSTHASTYARLGGTRNLVPLANGNDGRNMGNLNHTSDGILSVVHGNGHCSHSTSPVTTVAREEGFEAIDYDVQLSPEKALRAAMLKRRFADTIVRAKQNTLLCNGERGDSVKMQLEKEILDKKQQEAKIRVATKAALRRSQEAELRMQREKERQAARIVLEQMEKTVEIYENQEILEEIEVLGVSAYPLEWLGLSLKEECTEVDEDGAVDLTGDIDIEEGEIS